LPGGFFLDRSQVPVDDGVVRKFLLDLLPGGDRLIVHLELSIGMGQSLPDPLGGIFQLDGFLKIGQGLGVLFFEIDVEVCNIQIGLLFIRIGGQPLFVDGQTLLLATQVDKQPARIPISLIKVGIGLV